MGTPTRLPAGISTQAVNKTLGNYPNPAPTNAYTFFDDFNDYVAGNWTVANTSTGASALAAGVGGKIVQTTAIGATDYACLTDNPSTFNFTTAQQVWYETSIALSDVTVPTVLSGLTAGTIAAFTATPPTDGIFFYKAPASTVISLVIRKSSTSTTTTVVVPSGALVAATTIKLGFYYNGKDAVDVFVNGVKTTSVTTLTNLPAAVALAVSTGIGSGAGAVNTLTVDYILAAQDRA